ncbi:CPBP family intramembrane glutamic endopeptidase [Mucilaginibacter ginkgonis]|uniref:CPBP family intramembrane metalloprotease n=1 Tax=Mucilaginibacter ginkgonis TaxID=2682091 RepID=A0A6I4I005_9SPHI|nr:CPBP family intramembrane glutamic endopeptidase [Mucilaginibacter ginkgonis]QQL49522.1 CPBP family intramembrane metalloprotease [Mucilaginibacter ginkgonis]
MTETATSPMRPAFQFLVFVLCVLVAVFAGNILAGAVVAIAYGKDTLIDIANLTVSDPQAAKALWVLQVIGTTLPLFIAPVFFSYVVAREPKTYLKWSRPFPWQLIFITLMIMFFSLPVMEQLTVMNQKLSLPPFLKGIEQWMRDSEQKLEKLTQLLLKMDTPWDMIKALFLVAGVTAVVEELTFRGVLQTIFLRWTKNHHIAIWITAILFSAFHMEFFGFLPRLMLGVFFGYFVYWTGSVWSSVWAHFINNALAVVATYLYQHKTITTNPDDAQSFNMPIYIMSIVLVVSLLFTYRNIAIAGKKKLFTDGD